jgi:hypothetical protein
MLLDIPATLQISTHVLTGRVAGQSNKSNMDIGSNPTARFLSCCRHIADMSASDMLCHVDPVPRSTAFLCRVADMSADMSATCRPDKHMSVVLTLVSTCRHPTLPAKFELCYVYISSLGS